MQTGLDDILLIEDFNKGNEKAFEVLYNKYKRLFMSICLRYLPNRNDAEDALQDAFVSIYRNIDKYEAEKASFLTWSKKIILNTCLQKLRKPNLLSYFDNLLDFSYKTPIESKAIEDLNLQELTGLIGKLPKGYRTVFNLYVIEGYTHPEIAEMLKINISTSKTQLMKARNFLKLSIDSEELSLIGKYA